MRIFFKGMPEIKPMVIGLWNGNGKPSILNEFLLPFVNDIGKVIREGIVSSFLKGPYGYIFCSFI